MRRRFWKVQKHEHGGIRSSGPPARIPRQWFSGSAPFTGLTGTTDFESRFLAIFARSCTKQNLNATGRQSQSDPGNVKEAGS